MGDGQSRLGIRHLFHSKAQLPPDLSTEIGSGVWIGEPNVDPTEDRASIEWIGMRLSAPGLGQKTAGCHRPEAQIVVDLQRWIRHRNSVSSTVELDFQPDNTVSTSIAVVVNGAKIR